MKILTLTAVTSYYDAKDGDMPYWLPEGCVILSSKPVEASDEDSLKSDESLNEYSYTTAAEAVAHFGLDVKVHTEAEIAALLLRSDKAVRVACARLESVPHVRNRITEYACYLFIVADIHKAEARRLALANVSYLTTLANAKAAQQALDARWWAEYEAGLVKAKAAVAA